MKAIIVDDEIDSLDVIKMMLAEFTNDIQVIAGCTSVNDAIREIENNSPDLIFLDIEMPGKNGFDLLKRFPQPTFKVIFITGYDQYAIKAIKYSAADYLLKPLDIDDLKAAILKVKKILQTEDFRLTHLAKIISKVEQFNKLIISSQQGFDSIILSELESIEAQRGNYSIFRLRDGNKLIATNSLNYYEVLFSNTTFFRIHRSHIINIDYVEKYDNQSGEVKLKSGLLLNVAYRRRQDFKSLVKQHFIV